MNVQPNGGKVVAMAAKTHLVEDVDAIAAAMADGLHGEYVQLEPSPFRGRWTTVRIDAVVAQFGSQDTAVARRMRMPHDRWAFIVPLEAPGAARWNGHAIGPGLVFVCPPGAECLASDPASTRFAILTAGSTTMPVRAVQPFFVSNEVTPIAAACDSEAHALRDRLIGIRDRVEAGKVPACDPDDTLEGRLAACLARAVAAHGVSAARWTRSRIVCRAEAFLRGHISEGVSVSQLSMVAGVSERSLRNAFHDIYTVSPKRYMTLWRLHQVRRALRSARSVSVTVTEVATRHGFFELGRFAGEYRAFFGETPSETLNKARPPGSARHRHQIRDAA